MFKNKLFILSLTLSMVLLIPIAVSLISTDNKELVSVMDFSGEEEEKKSEIENLEFKIVFENNSNFFSYTKITKKILIFNSIDYSSIDRELHLPPPELV